MLNRKALLAVTLPLSPLAYPASCAASLMLQPVATRVSTSRACLLVRASCLLAIYTSSLIVEPPYVPPFYTPSPPLVNAQARASTHKHSQVRLLAVTPHLCPLLSGCASCHSNRSFVSTAGASPLRIVCMLHPSVQTLRCQTVLRTTSGFARTVRRFDLPSVAQPWPILPQGYSLHCSSKGGSYEQDY